jgi:hypothetical protein
MRRESPAHTTSEPGSNSTERPVCRSSVLGGRIRVTFINTTQQHETHEPLELRTSVPVLVRYRYWYWYVVRYIPVARVISG